MVRMGPYFFSHREVLKAKRTAKMSGSRFSRLDCTVRSGFQNLALSWNSPLILGLNPWNSFWMFVFLINVLDLNEPFVRENSGD